MNNETLSRSEMESFIAERAGPCVEVNDGSRRSLSRSRSVREADL